MGDENMQRICDLLLKTLQETRAGSKLTGLIYAVEPHKETVTMVFRNGGEKTINVTCDSGVALIYDVLKYL